MNVRKTGLFGGKGRHYKKSLIMILVVSGIPGLVIGAMVYWTAGGRLESELLKLHNLQIEQRAHNIDDQLTNLELMLSHWAFDPKFDYSLKGVDFLKDYERAHDITKTLVVMQGSNTMAKKVELYLAGEQGVMFDPEYSIVRSAALSENYKKLLKTDQITYWTQWAPDPSRPDDKDLTLIHHIPGGSLDPFGTLVVRMDTQKVSDMLRTMMPYNDGETFLLQDKGGIYVSAGGTAEKSPFVEALKEKMADSGETEGSFFFDWDGATYTVSYGHFSRIASNWTYVSASPITSITSPVVFISKLVFLISGTSLLLAALLSWLASRSIYSPVNRLLQSLLEGQTPDASQEDEFTFIERQWKNLNRESHELHSKLAEQLPHVKESFLHQLMQGYLYAYSEEDLRSRMERFKWDVENRRFIVVYIQLTGITSMEGKFKYGDEGLVTFAAVNIIGELASQYFEQSDTINFHDLTAGLLLLLPGERSFAQELQTFGEELTQSVNRILKMRVTLAISKPVCEVREIPMAFEAAKQAASYRNFENENQILDMEKEMDQGSDAVDMQYPFTLERELIQAMRTGQEADSYRLLEAFLEALSAKGAKEIDVQQGMLHLLGSVQHAVMVSGINPNRLFKGSNLYESLSQIRETKLILEWFREKVVAPFLTELLSRTDSQVKRIIEQAMIYLQNNYMNDISLDNCADHTGTNPFFLSKSFKQVTGKNFIDYLTELRMEKAKELLRETELRINDVADRVGYQHSYFNRIFKKLEGMTPSRYRELSQDK
jgi:AraC-like DNA-binding protein